MINTILGQKLNQTQKFTKNGVRIPVTVVKAGPCPVVQIKTKNHDGYWAIQLGFGEKKIKRTKKPTLGQIKKAGLEKIPRFLKEIRVEKEEGDNIKQLKTGSVIKVEDVFKVGDKVAVSGISKGKGFAGVVKRFRFAGGPRTRGQSDRERAPGSIGQTTTPGRVFKGKKMAGRMGGKRVTVKGLQVMDVEREKNLLILKGLIPGARGGFLLIKKTGEAKNFVPLFKKEENLQEKEKKKGDKN